MSTGRIIVSLATAAAMLVGLTGCGTLTRGLGYFSSAGLVDEYAIPQNRSLAMPTDFSRMPTPQNEFTRAESLPTKDEIEALVFSLEPDPRPEDDYQPITVIVDELPQYQPIGRIVASGSNGAATQFVVSSQTNAGGSIYPVVSSPIVPSVSPALAAPSVVATSGPAMVPLTAEQAAMLLATAETAPVPVAVPATIPSQPAAQVITSLPAGVTMIGEPVVVSQ